jgi:hypothetical protein
VILSEGEIDSIMHSPLDREEECMDDDDLIGVYSVSDVVCNTTSSQLIHQLLEQ